MRIAVMIIGIGLAILIMIHAGWLADLASTVNSDDGLTGAAGGFIVGLLLLIGGCLTFAAPIASLVLFAIGTMFAFLTGTTTLFGDMVIWGVLGFLLTLATIFAVLEKARAKARQVMPVAYAAPSYGQAGASPLANYPLTPSGPPHSGPSQSGPASTAPGLPGLPPSGPHPIGPLPTGAGPSEHSQTASGLDRPSTSDRPTALDPDSPSNSTPLANPKSSTD